MLFTIKSVPTGGVITNINERQFNVLKELGLIWEYLGEWVYDKENKDVSKHLNLIKTQNHEN